MYIPRLGLSHGTVVADLEWESLAEREKFYTDYFATPEGAARWERFKELVEDFRTEIFQLK